MPGLASRRIPGMLANAWYGDRPQRLPPPNCRDRVPGELNLARPTGWPYQQRGHGRRDRIAGSRREAPLPPDLRCGRNPPDAGHAYERVRMASLGRGLGLILMMTPTRPERPRSATGREARTLARAPVPDAASAPNPTRRPRHPGDPMVLLLLSASWILVLTLRRAAGEKVSGDQATGASACNSEAMREPHTRISSQSRRSRYCAGVFSTIERSIGPRGFAGTLPPKTT